MKWHLAWILVLAAVTALGGCGRTQPSPQVPQSQVTPPASEAQPPAPRKIETIRGPAVAGMFYPKSREELAKNIDELLAEADSPPVKNLRALVCPHAGYRYSGPIAAVGYKQLVGHRFHTVVVLAPSHYARFQGASIPNVDAYETPLGLIPLSSKADELAKAKPFVVEAKCDVRRPQWWRQAPKELPAFGEDTPHSWEHSLEVQLPFLQQTLKSFQLVPIVLGEVDAEEVARGLAKVVDKQTLLVASSDLSHYMPYDTALRLDTACVKAVCALDPESVQRQEACGKGPILALVHLAREKGWKTRLLDYRNSGDTAGDRSGVVGYAAIAFYEPGDAAEGEDASGHSDQSEFTPEQEKFLVKLARDTVDAAARKQPLPEIDEAEVDEALRARRACFVTLSVDGKLRGCIGSIFPQEPLCKAVISRARAAAVSDHRFPPVVPVELEQIDVEVSVLTLPRELVFNSPEDLLKQLRPGIDGVVLRVGERQSTYLPQVWEQIPHKRLFMNQLAKKAGLMAPDWMLDRAKVLVYQVTAFKESEMAEH